MMMALVCLQAQQVAGLPAAAEGQKIQLHLLQQQHQQEEEEQEEVAAAARCRAGVAAFHGQVLLLHCTPVNSITTVAVRVSCLHPHHHQHGPLYQIDLAAQLHHPSPSVLSFVLHAGAVLTLTLHHRLIRRRSACLPRPMIPDLLFNCLRTRRMPTDPKYDDGDQSSGFITIEKGTISRRRPPSDNLLTTDDEVDDKRSKPMALAEEELEVENEFLAKLDGDADLDALIKDAEAELATLHDLYL